ncbi:MAG: hypothetical protein AAGJ37_13600 [Pseudomonadota bacterium]
MSNNEIENQDIIDYINGHLSEKQRQQFEEDLKNNKDLQAEVEQSRQWQKQMRQTKAPLPTPQFSSIQNKLEKPNASNRNFGLGLSAAASVLLVAFIFVGVGFDGADHTIENNEFETLTDASVESSSPFIQIVLADGTYAEDVIAEYGFSIRQTYPNRNIIDVEYSKNTNLELLQVDPRIVLVKEIGKVK